MIKRIVLLLVLCRGLFTSFPVSAQDSSNPYIYYFSNTLNAFIIERADGTDTRILGDGLMALTIENATSIRVEGPGWSPSGRWFAWTASEMGIYGNMSGYRPYVVSADGAQRLNILDTLSDAQLTWAKDEDILFVASVQVEKTNPDDPADYHSVINTYFAVLDVASGTEIAAYKDQTFSDYRPNPGGPSPVVRTNDGKHFIVSYIDYEGGNSMLGTVVLVVLDTEGTITEKRLDDYDPGYPVSIDAYGSDRVSISPAGWITYPTAKGLIAANVLTGEQHLFPEVDTPSQTIWDAAGQIAMITDGNLWLFDCHTAELTLLRKNLGFGEFYYVYERSIWSPDSKYAFFLGGDNNLYAFDVSTETLTQLPVDTGGRYPFVQWHWLDDTHVAVYYTAEGGMLIYDLASLTAQHIDIELSGGYTHPRLSSDGRFVAFVHDGAVVYDTATKTYRRIRPDYRSYQTSPGTEIVWNDTNEWLLIFDDALVAGGANIRYLGITRADGTTHRDLSFSWFPSSIALNGLPPQVDPSDLPPAVPKPPSPQPAKILQGSNWSFSIDWSPNGRWIAAGSNWYSSGDITVWEVDTNRVIHVFEDAAENERVLWPQSETFVSQLTIPENIATGNEANILAVSPDGRQMVQLKRDNNQISVTQVIDTETGSVLADLYGEWDSYFFSASYSPDGRLLATANPYIPARIWDTSTWELVATTPNPAQAATFSPDSSQLAVTASWDIQIWDVDKLLEYGVQP